MIATVCWIPKGVAKVVPDSVEPPSQEEIQELLKLNAPSGSDDSEDSEEENEGMVVETNKNIDEVAKALAAANAIGSKSAEFPREQNVDDIADGLKELDMDNYDDEDEGIDIFGTGSVGSCYYASNDMDPYIVDQDDDDEDEIEDMTIKPSDLIILSARNEDDVSHLEMWVYEEQTEDGGSNMYVHHDIILPAFPLSLAWLDCNLKGGDKGNFVAVGTMQLEIEIWDLDVLDAVEPAVVLGGPVKGDTNGNLTKLKKKKKKKNKEAITFKEGSHIDSVLGLAWNTEYRNVLASASADNSVKIWDIVAEKCEHTVRSHTDKVQAVAWNSNQATVLLSGSFDRSVVMTDMRAPTHPGIRWPVPADVESLAWDPHTDHSFVVSLEDGTVRGFDIRGTASAADDGSKPIFTLHAHDKAVCTISYNPAAPNLLATGSMDKMVKLWDMTNNQPLCIASINPKIGAVFSACFSRDSPFLLASGGSKGVLHVWDTLDNSEVARRFGAFRPQNQS
uniref:Anaphase-promoting complex subunit 4-like WD40 domain-containing protein n=1 Tax=Araucaria cunninghamii TaxID=56994 RepID=A0A0D6R4C8_ARACU